MKPCRTTEEFGGNRLTQKLLRNGVKTTFDYDHHIVGDENQGINRITDIKHFKTVAEEDDELLIHLQWPREEYDPLGNRLRMNRVKFPYVGGQFGSGSYVKYAYDKTSQLLSEKMFLANDTEFLKQEVPAAGGYDAAGNRLQYNITDHGIEKQIASSYDEANQINARNVSFPSVPDQGWQTTFAHDFRGNTTQKDQPAGAGQEAVTWDYTFNIFNKLTKLEKTKLGVKTEFGFKYGADGYRVEKELVGGAGVSPVRRLYILDGVHVILEKEIVGEGEPVTKVRYIPGVCMITKDDADEEVIRYYHEDALGSFIAMTDEHQNLTALYQYDAWGNELLPQVSSLSPQPSENPYRWCGALGYYRDRDAQMYLLGMRWYDAETGRFISRDPIGLESYDPNLQRYVWNSPAQLTDPMGLDNPGCDFPVVREIPSIALQTIGGRNCLLRCCAKHDFCYFEHDPPCTASSWISASGDCQWCNAKVVACWLACAAVIGRIFVRGPRWFCPNPRMPRDLAPRLGGGGRHNRFFDNYAAIPEVCWIGEPKPPQERPLH
jgi:RHS repeat-associated protein